MTDKLGQEVAINTNPESHWRTHRVLVRIIYHYWMEQDGKPGGEVLELHCFLLGPLGSGDGWVNEVLYGLTSDAAYMHQLVTNENGGVASEDAAMEIGGELAISTSDYDEEADIHVLWRDPVEIEDYIHPEPIALEGRSETPL